MGECKSFLTDACERQRNDLAKFCAATPTTASKAMIRVNRLFRKAKMDGRIFEHVRFVDGAEREDDDPLSRSGHSERTIETDAETLGSNDLTSGGYDMNTSANSTPRSSSMLSSIDTAPEREENKAQKTWPSPVNMPASNSNNNRAEGRGRGQKKQNRRGQTESDRKDGNGGDVTSELPSQRGKKKGAGKQNLAVSKSKKRGKKELSDAENSVNKLKKENVTETALNNGRERHSLDKQQGQGTMAQKDEKLDINTENKLTDSKQSEKPNRGTVELEKEDKNNSVKKETKSKQKETKGKLNGTNKTRKSDKIGE